MSDRFTEEQRAAIDAEGRVIVSASAGSGKTTVMIEKIIRLILSGTDVGEILAVTFTKKAAAQMKEKLCKALIDSINSTGISAEKRTALKKQLSEIPNADISTIHSFCAKLIRSHFFAAEVDNTFRVIGGDDAEGTALKNEALDELFEEAYEDKNEQFNHLLSVYWRKKSDNALRAIFISVYEKLRNRADYQEYLEKTLNYTEQTFEDICSDLKERLNGKCRYYKDMVERELEYFHSIGALPQIALSEELIALLNALENAPDYFSVGNVEKPKFTAKRTSKTDSQEKLLHVERLAFLKNRVVKTYEEAVNTLPKEEELAHFLRSGETAQALAVYLLRFDEKYARLKAEHGVLDYNDLEHKALALLAQSEIAEEIKEKYAYVFVDEYQDVNPVQEKIVSLLSGENLFLVGDVKQSIYGFRGSKSRFFVEKQKQFQSGEGKALAMTRNFRSSDAVLEAVNTQFSLAMTPQLSEVDYARDSYMERGGRYALNSGRVQIHFLGKEEKKKPENRGVYSVRQNAGKRETEESLTAKRIRSIIEQERKSKFFDADTGEYRNVQYSDIAILSRKKQGQIARTVAELSAEGVPVTAAASVNICEYTEVKTLIDILSLIDNAEQDVPLCSALLSAMGNMTADELTDIRLAYPEENFFRNACKRYAAEKTDKTAWALCKFFEYYAELRRLSCVLDAGELLTKILSETRMEARLLSRENGVACLRRIHRFIEEADATDSLCVHAFLERLRDLDYDIQFSENGGEDSVKVLTMHSSKGLEYPIVILDNLSAPFRGVDHDEVLVEEKYGLAPKAFDAERMTKASTLLRRLYEEKESDSSVADELNLYYVALTRAKYGLHLLFEEPTPLADVKYARSFAEFTDFSVWEKYITEESVFDLPKQERTALVFRPDETLTRKIMDAFLWEYPYAGSEDLPVKSSATDLLTEISEGSVLAEKNSSYLPFGSVSEEQKTLEEEYLFEREHFSEVKKDTDKTGIEEGLAYHAFLETFDFSLLFDEVGNAVTTERLQGIVGDSYQAFKAQKAEESALIREEKLLEILSNPVFYTLRDTKLYKEQQFLVSLPVKDTYAKKKRIDRALAEKLGDEEMIFQGAIDLLSVGEQVRIIDYKYSRGNAEYLKEHYRPQLELYKQAVAKIMRIDPSVVKCSIVNIYHGFQVDLE